MSRLYRSRISTTQVVVVLLVGIVAFLVAIASTPAGQAWLTFMQSQWRDLIFWIRGLFA